MRQRIYIDTSVIGGCFDDEFYESSLLLYDKFVKGDYIAVIAELTRAELSSAPEKVRNLFNKIPVNNIENVDLSKDALELARLYINDKVISISKLADAEHIAIATINKVDVLVSWNFKHIVNLERIRGYNSVNLKEGYSILEIRTPKEVVKYE
jgi:hypothetical protein